MWLHCLLTMQLLAVSAVKVHIQPGDYGPCSYSDPTLNCADKGLSTIPSIDPGVNVQFLYLDSNPIASIDTNSFVNLTKLVQLNLDLQVQSLDRVDAGAFNGLTSLKTLKLIARRGNAASMNQASIADMLVDLQSLQELHVENVKLQDLPINFAAGTKLRTMKLNYNEISKIDNLALANASELQLLDLSHNQLAVDSHNLRWLASAAKLVEVKLISCSIINFGQIPELQHLRRLFLSNNGITAIGLNSLENVRSTLTELHLDGNSIPDSNTIGLQQLTALQKLYMQNNNQLSAVPPQLRQLQQLQLLDARATGIASLQALDFHANSQLQTLQLDYSRVSSIHADCFKRLQSLIVFTFSSNIALHAISIIDSSGATRTGEWNVVLQLLPKLTTLQLSGAAGGSNLNSTIWQPIKLMSNLNSLFLSHNNIDSIPDFLFQHLPNITSIDLSHNHIEHLTSAAFYSLSSTTKLRLDNNRIRTMDNCTLSMFNSLASISLNGNPFHCNCSIQWLHLKLQATAPQALQQLQCAEPIALNGTKWSAFNASSLCSNGQLPPANCIILQPITTAAPTTAYPFKLRINISDVGDAVGEIVLQANTQSVTGQFIYYYVSYWPTGEFQLTQNSTLQPIVNERLQLTIGTQQQYTFCYNLVSSTSNSISSSSSNCRTHLAAAAEAAGGLSTAAAVGIGIAAAVGAALLLAAAYFAFRRGRNGKTELKSRDRNDEDPYTYTYPDDRGHTGPAATAATAARAGAGGRYLPTMRPDSKRFSKRSMNTLAGSRPSLAASTSTIATTVTAGAPPLPARTRGSSSSLHQAIAAGDTEYSAYVDMHDPNLQQHQQQQQQQQQQLPQQRREQTPPQTLQLRGHTGNGYGYGYGYDNSAFHRNTTASIEMGDV